MSSRRSQALTCLKDRDRRTRRRIHIRSPQEFIDSRIIFRCALGSRPPRPPLLRESLQGVRDPPAPRNLHPGSHSSDHRCRQILLDRKVTVNTEDQLGQVPPRLTTEFPHRKPRARLKDGSRRLRWWTAHTGESEIDEGQLVLGRKGKTAEFEYNGTRSRARARARTRARALAYQDVIDLDVPMVESQPVL